MSNTIERETSPSQTLVKASFGLVSLLSPVRTPGYISAIECSRTEYGTRLATTRGAMDPVAWGTSRSGAHPGECGSPCRRSAGANSDPGVEADRRRVLLQKQVDGLVIGPVHRQCSAKTGRKTAHEAGGKA
jgi:hypothetical protein